MEFGFNAAVKEEPCRDGGVICAHFSPSAEFPLVRTACTEVNVLSRPDSAKFLVFSFCRAFTATIASEPSLFSAASVSLLHLIILLRGG